MYNKGDKVKIYIQGAILDGIICNVREHSTGDAISVHYDVNVYDYCERDGMVSSIITIPGLHPALFEDDATHRADRGE